MHGRTTAAVVLQHADPACLWFLNKAPEHRRGQTLFIDARDMGTLVSRVRRELDDDDIAHIAGTFQDWQRDEGSYEDVPGFCKSATLDEIAGHGFVLTPGRYVGAAAAEDDGEPFDEKMARLTAELAAQFEERRGWKRNSGVIWSDSAMSYSIGFQGKKR